MLLNQVNETIGINHAYSRTTPNAAVRIPASLAMDTEVLSFGFAECR
jgi:hypothetical protein